MINLLITGCGGMLGSYLSKRFQQECKNINVISTTRKELDISSYKSVDNFFNNNKIDYIINCAGVKADYNDFEKLFRGNSLGCKILAQKVQQDKRIIKLIHISTDAVYSECSRIEDQITEFPSDKYGMSKLLGEEYIQRYITDSHRYLICRPSWMYGPDTESTFIHKFIKAYNNAIKNNQAPKLVTDSVGKPIDCEFIFLMLQKLSFDNKCYGLCDLNHDMDNISRYDFGIEICNIYNEIYPNQKMDTSIIQKCSIDDFEMKYRVPKEIFSTKTINYIKEIRKSIPYYNNWKYYLFRFIKDNI